MSALKTFHFDEIERRQRKPAYNLKRGWKFYNPKPYEARQQFAKAEIQTRQSLTNLV